MSEFRPLREELETLAARAPMPDFGELQYRVNRRRRRSRVMTLAALAAVIAGSTYALAGPSAFNGIESVDHPTSGPAPNGWVAVDTGQSGGDIYLTRPGENAQRLEVTGSDTSDDACPVWSPDGTRLMFGRLTGSSDTTAGDAQLVIVPVDQSGTSGNPIVIGLDGYQILDGDPHPCGTWAPDGRWAALAGPTEVWVVDTQTHEIRRLPGLRPRDLEWRPGTDELAIAGDMGTNRVAPTQSTPITLYSVSSGQQHQLGTVLAAQITWSPDGTKLAYTGGENAPTRELRIVDSDGTHDRLLVADTGPAIHGIGPVWSPTGDRIVYQRCAGDGEEFPCNDERHQAVIVNVADGTQKVIEPPKADGHLWYPFTVSWSPDSTMLRFAAWHNDGQPLPDGGVTMPEGVIAVPVAAPGDATLLIDSNTSGSQRQHIWTPIQMWGRNPQ